jgi:hypothetical protein
MKVVVLGLVLGSALLAPMVAHAQASTANWCVTASQDDGREILYTNGCTYVVNLNLERNDDLQLTKTLGPKGSYGVETVGNMDRPDNKKYTWQSFACQSPQWAADYVTGSHPTSSTVRWVCQNSK